MPAEKDLQLHEQLERKIPVAPLGLIIMPSASELGSKVDNWLVQFRSLDHNIVKKDPAFRNYVQSTFSKPFQVPRFGSGEGKAVLEDTVRGYDIYIISDVCNYSLTYRMNGFTNHYSPDDHFQDVKRVISAINGKAHRISVIMPFLYEGRQHLRSGRESLDCAIMLKELYGMGVSNFITFDAHDPRVQNVEPLSEFDNFLPPYQFLRTLMMSVPDLTLDKDHITVISPDEGAMERAIYFANVIGVDTGAFYKRRDYSKIVNGKNPIVAHEFLGSDIEGKDVIVIDDMISSGGSMLDTSRQLKELHAKRVFICCTFGLFTDGPDAFDDAYEKGWIDKVVVTNLNYIKPEIKSRPWFASADMSKYLASIIDYLNHDSSVGSVTTPTSKIHEILEKYNRRESTEPIDV
ncbi:MAG: ribose-phosphate pyrophosphokinase [Lachnospiraceae bacterium]|jgi:ribose-phosphate pyrophosphokinase|nr:ribose-phosphate pyrophosphokinase [Lachnospiraceae bacterium]MCH4027557.1 ribose-phosphate pyrophosphokinase [Lachnospiraceae bacterium]MCH4065397.1 ribose-phosphate pyrophosphokinase [Lachnospiraceae bacterium]MCH4111437.1 ribose-phosphate pyrophosphokinase [Lachnospiraceae bacterium]MCI1353033.1 ribose-phosphate pyrophosphokinase [Lachnospiraceae bacterium]